MIARVIAWSARNLLLVLFGTGFAAAAGFYALLHLPLDAIPDTLAAWQRREPEANWTSVLVSRHLASPAPDADTAARMVPPVAWYSALTWAIRLLTGSCSQAYFQSPGEGSAQSPHLALEQPLKDLRTLLYRTRALVTMEWKANLEVRDQIMAVMEK